MKGLISIVTVCYNAEDCIECTMRSVLEQSYKGIEYIIVDGNSQDNTIQIINKVINEYPQHHINFLSESDNGIYDAMNKGIFMANGSWINFMNAGDVFFDSSILERISKYLVNDNDVVYGDFVVNKRNRQLIIRADSNAIKVSSRLNMGFNHQASFVKTELAKKYPFDLSYRLAADFHMMKTLYKNNARFYKTDIVIVKYDLKGMSNQNVWQHRYECLSIVNPRRPILNKILASIYYVKMHMQSFLASNLYSYFPGILNMYYNIKFTNNL